MKTFNIVRPDEAIRQRLEFKNNDLTKPKGALGRLEDIAIQLGMIQQTLTPRLKNPHNILFAGDHGAAEENISKSPKEITWQVLYNFIEGGQGINFLCRQHGFVLDIVDVGVDHDFEARCLSYTEKLHTVRKTIAGKQRCRKTNWRKLSKSVPKE